MNLLDLSDNEITSVSVSKEILIKHGNILSQIDTIINNYSKDFAINFQESIYVDGRGKKRRIYILTPIGYDFFMSKRLGFGRIPHRLREESALKTIEQLLNISLIRQFNVLNYYVDGYHEDSNTVYEIYEQEHNRKNDYDAARENLDSSHKCNSRVHAALRSSCSKNTA